MSLDAGEVGGMLTVQRSERLRRLESSGDDDRGC